MDDEDDDETDGEELPPPNILLIDEEEAEGPDEQIENIDNELGARNTENDDNASEVSEDRGDEDQDEDDITLIKEEVLEDACHDLESNNNERVDAEDTPDTPTITKNTAGEYITRSGRVVKTIDYRNMQLTKLQVKRQARKEVRSRNLKGSPKKLRQEVKFKKNSLKQSSFKDLFRRLTGVMFSKISKDSKFSSTNFNEGVKRHGGKSIEALLMELSHLDNMNTFMPLIADNLSAKDKKLSLNLLVIIREKRCGKFKGRVVADGRKQRDTVPREDAASPTIQLERLIMSMLIDAKEDRDVAVLDIVSAYLIAEMMDHVVVKLTGNAVDVMCTTNEKYKRFVVKKR